MGREKTTWWDPPTCAHRVNASAEASERSRAQQLDISVSVLRWLRDMGAALRSPYDLLLLIFRGWPGLLLDHPAVDAVLWGVVTAVESLALAAMICTFFLCCGCTL